MIRVLGFFTFFTYVLIQDLCLCQPINREVGIHRVGGEKKYPNGTIIGKYSYLDEEGNPTHVRYYADDSSYGVELKSLKISGSKEGKPKYQQTNLPMTEKASNPVGFRKDSKNSPYHEDISFNLRHPKQLYRDIENESTCDKRSSDKRKRPDYDVYVQNDLDVPLTCGNKEKITVYLDEKLNHANTNTRNKYKHDAGKYGRNNNFK